jgi:nicotinamide riboside kinase
MISISGAPGAGKTTLCEQLGRVRSDATVVADVPLHALERLDAHLTAWNDVSFQHYVGYAQLLAESSARRAALRLCDKSLVDAVGYWDVLFGGERPHWATELARRRYALVILCDFRDIAPSDLRPVQRLHLEVRETLARRIEAVAQETGVEVLRVSGTRESRLDAALAAIERLVADAPSLTRSV